MRDRERLDPGVGIERAEHPPHVVAHGVGAQVELFRDLRGGAPACQQVQDLVLARRQVRVGVRSGLRLAVRDDAEDADDPAALPERNCADLDLDTLAAGLDHDDRGIGRLLRSHHLAEKRLLGRARLLGHDHGRLLASANVAHELVGGGIDPADDPVAVDCIARDVHLLEGAVDIVYKRDLDKAKDKVRMRSEKIDEFREKYSNPYVAAERGYIDAVIQPHETRKKIISALEMLQTKRDKNPPKKHGNIPL